MDCGTNTVVAGDELERPTRRAVAHGGGPHQDVTENQCGRSIGIPAEHLPGSAVTPRLLQQDV